ncbi:hypothetical protein G3I60_15110 [Streptomyces sp. SID13666]|nr:hypothetical protein [Streptomyces sp. SID13666]NEA71642.1 hypothetical protein [Streptomyces sp. SID13588]
MLSAEHAERLTHFAADGGSLVVSFFSGIVDEHDRVHLGGYPAPLRDVLGLYVEEFWPADEGATFPVREAADGGTSHEGRSSADLWREDVVLTGAAPELLFAGRLGRPPGGDGPRVPIRNGPLHRHPPGRGDDARHPGARPRRRGSHPGAAGAAGRGAGLGARRGRVRHPLPAPSHRWYPRRGPSRRTPGSAAPGP